MSSSSRSFTPTSSATRAATSAVSSVASHLTRHHHSAWHRFGRWVLTGVLVGVFVLALLLGCCIFLCVKRRKSKKASKAQPSGGTETTFNKRHNEHGMVENGYGSHSTYGTTKSVPQNSHAAPAYTTHPATTTVPAAAHFPQHNNTANVPSANHGYHVTNGAPEMTQHGAPHGAVQAMHGTGAGNHVPAIVQPDQRY